MNTEFYINKIIKYLSSDYKVDKHEKDNYYLLNVYMEIKYDTFFINEIINKKFPYLKIEYHIPSIIIHDNIKYDINEDIIPKGISFITLKIYK